ncbi:MAG: DUF5694 domain-containing protein, partial [Bacteroidota bacterium]
MKQLLTTLLILASFLTAQATEPNGPKTEVLLVGVHYLPADMLRTDRQHELEQVVQSLALFNPERIMVDLPLASERAYQMRDAYQGYLMGLDRPNSTAQEQLGFRLAEMMELEELNAFGTDAPYDLATTLQRLRTSQAEETPVDEFLTLGRGVETAKQYHLYEGSISQYLAYLNDPRNLDYEHGLYVEGLSRLDASYDHAGARTGIAGLQTTQRGTHTSWPSGEHPHDHMRHPDEKGPQHTNRAHSP